MATEVQQAFEKIQAKQHEHTAQTWKPQKTLTSHDYASQEVWESEKEKVFFSEWIQVGREEEIPKTGDLMVRPVANETIIIVRGKDDVIRSFYNVCAHRGTKLCDDDSVQHAKSNVIKCPYHA